MEKNKSERSIGWLVEEIMKGSVEKNRNRQEQELIRRGEFRDRTERLVRNLMVEELDKAREEGYQKGWEDGSKGKVFEKIEVETEVTFKDLRDVIEGREDAGEFLSKLTTK